jgi:hypothetical protein
MPFMLLILPHVSFTWTSCSLELFCSILVVVLTLLLLYVLTLLHLEQGRVIPRLHLRVLLMGLPILNQSLLLIRDLQLLVLHLRSLLLNNLLQFLRTILWVILLLPVHPMNLPITVPSLSCRILLRQHPPSLCHFWRPNLQRHLRIPLVDLFLRILQRLPPVDQFLRILQ